MAESTKGPTAIHGRRLQVAVVTPERAVLEQPADSVVVPLFDGELGILPGRAPLIGRLGIGELRIRRGEQLMRLYVDGGFVQVRGDMVTVLTSSAQTAEEIQLAEAETALQQATRARAVTDQQLAERDKAQRRARAKIRVARRKASRLG
ncbi:MAG: ATP synthase F1 subunit epsilon [Gemmataceae bacterium]|nr:ATP synthase F1 subunit epsilon [Gemmataceae bacterium]